MRIVLGRVGQTKEDACMKDPVWEREHVVALIRALQEGGEEATAKAGPPGSRTFEVPWPMRWREGCRASVIVDPRSDLSRPQIRLGLRLATPGDTQVRVLPLDEVVTRQRIPAGAERFLLGRVDGQVRWIEANVASLFTKILNLGIEPVISQKSSSKGVATVTGAVFCVGARWELDQGGGAHEYGTAVWVKWPFAKSFVDLQQLER
ncbi:hypothetical protein KBD13_03500 [Patescibacteria group bacterium]|nr:hypothetical protein [Patescibacteria group bacterium]